VDGKDQSYPAHRYINPINLRTGGRSDFGKRYGRWWDPHLRSIVSVSMSLQIATEGLLNELRERVSSDFGQVLPQLDLQFIPYSEWVATDPLVEPSDGEDVVCITDRGGFPIQASRGVEVSCVLVASHLQDDVMDDLGRPWPLLRCGDVEIVPTPALDDAGRACWVLDGRFKCPIGYLTTSFQSFGMLDSAIAAP
jgi:hypothetical protein